jgi:hypothetical protein
MSSLRRIQSSKANGARSKGPSTAAGKLRSSLNAIRHGLCAKSTIMEDESGAGFPILLQQHIDRFRPGGEVEFGMIEEMSAACWRERSAWSMESRLIDSQTARHPECDALDRMVTAFRGFAASRSLSLLNRYETRLHRLYQRALLTFVVRRSVVLPNEPSPISEHSPLALKPPKPQQSTDSEALTNTRLSRPRPSPATRSPAPIATAARPSAPQTRRRA